MHDGVVFDESTAIKGKNMGSFEQLLKQFNKPEDGIPSDVRRTAVEVETYFTRTGVVWTCRHNKRHDIGMMSDSHLVGAIKYMREKIADAKEILGRSPSIDREWQERLECEAARRRKLRVLIDKPFEDIMAEATANKTTENELFRTLALRFTSGVLEKA